MIYSGRNFSLNKSSHQHQPDDYQLGTESTKRGEKHYVSSFQPILQTITVIYNFFLFKDPELNRQRFVTGSPYLIKMLLDSFSFIAEYRF